MSKQILLGLFCFMIFSCKPIDNKVATDELEQDTIALKSEVDEEEGCSKRGEEKCKDLEEECKNNIGKYPNSTYPGFEEVKYGDKLTVKEYSSGNTVEDKTYCSADIDLMKKKYPKLKLDTIKARTLTDGCGCIGNFPGKNFYIVVAIDKDGKPKLTKDDFYVRPCPPHCPTGR